MSPRKIFETELPDGGKAHLYGSEAGDQEIHIDGAWGFTFASGACKINLYTIAPTAEKNLERREVVARITMVVPTLFALRDYLDRQCKMLEKDGIVFASRESAEAAGERPKDPDKSDS